MTKKLTRHLRPRPLRAAQGLKRLGHAEYADVVEAAADDLHADRKPWASYPPLIETAGFSAMFHGTV